MQACYTVCYCQQQVSRAKDRLDSCTHILCTQFARTRANYIYTNVYHLNLLIWLPEILPCVAATVISSISGSARCHRVHLAEPLLLFIFHKELIATIAIKRSAKIRMKTGHTGLYGARCRVEVLFHSNMSIQQECTLYISFIPMPYLFGASTLGTQHAGMVLCAWMEQLCNTNAHVLPYNIYIIARSGM